jgi:hypothetical protein
LLTGLVPRVLSSTPTTAIGRPNKKRSTRNLVNCILRTGAFLQEEDGYFLLKYKGSLLNTKFCYSKK